MTHLVTVSDDRSGRKGGRYEATQQKIKYLLAPLLPAMHWVYEDFDCCDPLMVYADAAKNGRVYKPWCIKQTLALLAMGDYLIYNDCSPEMWPDDINLDLYSLHVIEALCRQANDVLVGFVKWSDTHLGPGMMGMHTHHNFTLDSCIELMHGQRYRNSFLCASGMVCIRKTEITVALVDNWLHYNRIPECACMNVDETENSYHDGRPGRKLGNRHDQSVLSMLLNQRDWRYCDIAYNSLSPYNFLNFCLPGHDYQFIKSNQ